MERHYPGVAAPSSYGIPAGLAANGLFCQCVSTVPEHSIEACLRCACFDIVGNDDRRGCAFETGPEYRTTNPPVAHASAKTRIDMQSANANAYGAMRPRISPSLPVRLQAAQPMAIFCGEIIFPALTPSELDAASHKGSTPIEFAACTCTLPKSTSLEVPEPVTKVPSAPSRGGDQGIQVSERSHEERRDARDHARVTHDLGACEHAEHRDHGLAHLPAGLAEDADHLGR